MNNTAQIRQGLINYIGSLLRSLSQNKSPEEASHLINAMLLEEALNLSKNDQEEINFCIAKPIFKSVLEIIDTQIQTIEKDLEFVQGDMFTKLKLKQDKTLALRKTLVDYIESI